MITNKGILTQNSHNSQVWGSDVVIIVPLKVFMKWKVHAWQVSVSVSYPKVFNSFKCDIQGLVLALENWNLILFSST